jgi:hypothetical protein
LLDLSEELNIVDSISVPQLNGTDTSHILWADDLVFLVLDGPQLQRLIDVVHLFCSKLGLSVSKTVLLIFVKSGSAIVKSAGGPQDYWLYIPAEKCL